jgi:hypothetical protein
MGKVGWNVMTIMGRILLIPSNKLSLLLVVTLRIATSCQWVLYGMKTK